MPDEAISIKVLLRFACNDILNNPGEAIWPRPML